MPAVFTFTVSGSVPTVADNADGSPGFCAETHCDGKRVDLTWNDPPGITVTEWRLKRSRRAFSLFVDDTQDLIFSGLANSYSDTGLEENAFYYYTLYWTVDGVNFFVGDQQRVIGHSITNFQAMDGDHWLYDQLPAEVRRLDALPGTDQFVLRRYIDTLQCGVNLMRGKVEGYEHLTDYDDIVAGRISKPGNAYAVLTCLSDQLGFPAQKALGLETMRRVALELTAVRKWKGTCAGIELFVKLITTWDANCVDVSLGDCGGGTVMRVWDGSSSISPGQGSLTGVGGPIDNAAGQLGDTGAAFTPSLFKRGVTTDAFGNFACIDDNTATVITFDADDAAKQLVAEVVFTGAAASVASVLVLTRSAGDKPFNDSVYEGYKIKDTGGTVRDILTTVASTDGLTLTLTLSGDVVGGDKSIAVDFLNEPLSYAAREPELHYKAYSGEHYWLFRVEFDERERGQLRDPFDVLWGGGALTGGSPLTPGDIIVWVAAGIADVVGTSSLVFPDKLVDLTQAWTPGEWEGFFLNPNRNSQRLFRIVTNTATELILDPAEDITQVAAAGESYFILDPLEALRYEALVATIPTILPFKTRAQIWYLT